MPKKFIQDNVVCRTYSAPTMQELLQNIAESTMSYANNYKSLHDGTKYLGVFWTLDIQVDDDGPVWRGYLYYYDSDIPQVYD